MGLVAVVYSGMITTAFVLDHQSEPELVALTKSDVSDPKPEAAVFKLTYHACGYAEQISRSRHEWHTIPVEAIDPYAALTICMHAYNEAKTSAVAVAR